MPNRSEPPPVQTIQNLQLPLPEKQVLDCGIPVYLVDMGTQDVIKTDFVCHAGRPYESRQMVARATLTMLKEGTTQHHAAEIAEKIDFYGSNLSFPVNLDTSNIELVCLTKHFDVMAALLAEMIIHPLFPQKELVNYKENSRQRLRIELAQPDVIAYRTITELMFGTDHPYGYNSHMDGYAMLDRTHLVEHWKNNYLSNQCCIILSGKISPSVLPTLSDCFRQMPTGATPLRHFPRQDDLLAPQRLHIDQEGAVQSAIRVGRRLRINRKHDDFHDLLLLNTVLGGYFGSRLMANIREEKGYTYNIYSTIDAMHEDSYFCIATEVSNDQVAATLQEIYHELDRLQRQPVGKMELKMVQNYMSGNLLTMLDGPFNIANVVRTIVSESLEFSDFDKLVDTLQTITPDRLQELAKKYLHPAEMCQVVVGSPA